MIKATGTTTIQHKIRQELGITAQEYITMDFLHNNAKNNVIENDISDKFTKFTGYSKDIFNTILNQLHEKSLISFGSAGGKDAIGLTPKWTQYFDTDKEFEHIWSNVWLKKGNRANSLMLFKTVRKTVPYEVLLKAAQSYMATKKDTERKYIKAFEVWLNPSKKHWEDVLEVKEQKEVYQFKKN